MPLLLSPGDLGPRTLGDRTRPLAPDATPSRPWPLLTAPWAASRVPQPRDLSDPGRVMGLMATLVARRGVRLVPVLEGEENRLKGVTSASWGCIRQRGLAPGTNIPGPQVLNPTQTPPPRSRAGTRDEPRTHFLGSGRLPLDLSIQSVEGKRARLDGGTQHSPPTPAVSTGPQSQGPAWFRAGGSEKRGRGEHWRMQSL